MNKNIILIIVFILICAFLIFAFNYETKLNKSFYESNETDKERLCQGPIPEGYDEEYFRETCELKLEEKNNEN